MGYQFIQAAQAKGTEIQSREDFDPKKDKVVVKNFAVDDAKKQDLRKPGLRQEDMVTTKQEILTYLIAEKKEDDKLAEFHYLGHSWETGLSLAMTGELPSGDRLGPRNENVHLRASDIQSLTIAEKDALKKSFVKEAVIRLWGFTGTRGRDVKLLEPGNFIAGALAEVLKGTGAKVYTPRLLEQRQR